MNLRDAISNIKLPNSNHHFENDSADGFAFLGYGKAKCGLNTDNCLKAIEDRNFCLNAAQKIRKIEVPENNQYVYTLWSCIEFLDAISADYNGLVNIIDSISTYDNGMMRYCSSEIFYQVPNVTSATALIYAMVGRHAESQNLISLLRKSQENGNWRHMDRETNTPFKEEDPYHLAMIVYHLRETNSINGVEVSDILEKSLKRLNRMNRKKLGINRGSIGWGPPMLYAATYGLDDNLASRSYEIIKNKSINHKNFRVRGISAWALAKSIA